MQTLALPGPPPSRSEGHPLAGPPDLEAGGTRVGGKPSGPPDSVSHGKADSEAKVAAVETKRTQKSDEKEFAQKDEGHLDVQVSAEEAADVADEAKKAAKKATLKDAAEAKEAAALRQRMQKSDEKEFAQKDEGHLDVQVSAEEAADAVEKAKTDRFGCCCVTYSTSSMT